MIYSYSYQFPSNEEEWKHIAQDFDTMWDFPNCLGAVDGKHVRIVPPADSGSYFYNYKGSHSLVLMAVVNAKYKFIMCDIGVKGRISDGGVFMKPLFMRNFAMTICILYLYLLCPKTRTLLFHLCSWEMRHLPCAKIS